MSPTARQALRGCRGTHLSKDPPQPPCAVETSAGQLPVQRHGTDRQARVQTPAPDPGTALEASWCAVLFGHRQLIYRRQWLLATTARLRKNNH